MLIEIILCKKVFDIELKLLGTLVIERHLQGKVFYFVPSFQNSMRESSSGGENYKKRWKYVQQNSIYNTYINFLYIIQ